jgi:hypothetical protein
MSSRSGVTIAAAGFAAIGLALLFGPGETGGALLPGAGGPLMQMLGGAMLGFAAMNWTARGAALGGIYGRAVVISNQVHTTIGALVLLRHGVEAGGTTAYWLLAGFYVLAAIFFSYLAFFRSGLPKEP